MKIPFVDLHAQYLSIKAEIDAAIAEVIAQSAFIRGPHLPAWTEARRRVAARYGELLNGVGDVVTPKVAPGREHVYHLYVIRTESGTP